MPTARGSLNVRRVRALVWGVGVLVAMSLAGCSQSSDDPLAKTPGAVAYRKYCVSCHLANGQGIAGVQPPLALTPVPNGSETELLNWVMYGIRPAALPAGHYSGVMPQFNYVHDAELAALLSYVRQSFGNHSSPITADMVARVRAQHEHPEAGSADPATNAPLSTQPH